MYAFYKGRLQDFLLKSLKPLFPSDAEIPPLEITIPEQKEHGEFSTNIALKSAKIFRKPPMVLAGEFCQAIQRELSNTDLRDSIAQVEVKGPGFINFRLAREAYYKILASVFAQGERFGSSDFGHKKKILLEFVSANPTGPLSVAHARQAAVGDALAQVLRFIGFDVQKEFYVNDEGNQINLLGRSVFCRAKEILGEPTEIPEGGYQGEYIRDMAQDFLEKRKIESLAQLDEIPAEDFSRFGVETLMAVIRKELDDFGVHFDVWSHQSEVANAKETERALNFLKQKGFLYDKDGASWFQSTKLGDDKDRVVRKSDGAYTYLAPDIAYHQQKYQRGVDQVINIWGPDHHGYIPRLRAAVEALGYDPKTLTVLIVQLATIFRQGQPVSMSTRRGQYISLREVMDEVGVDAARFFFLMRHINIHLEFDLELAKKESPENPVYYIQYAHARIHSIVKKAKETGLDVQVKSFAELKEEAELELIKTIALFPDSLFSCQQQLDPFPLVDYLLQLAICFHKFYDRHRVIDPENPGLSSERLLLSEAVRVVLANGLRLLGVSAPEKM
jgi:arginyl-tRNA synthetase